MGLLLEILRYKFEADLVSCVEAFERKVREYEKQSGKDVDDDTVIGIVILRTTDAAVKEHLVRHTSRLDAWSKMRAEIVEIARTQQYLRSTPQDMDIGAFPKGNKGDRGGKGKDKGKDSKGKDKGKGKGKDKDKSNSAGGGGAGKGQRICFYCNKPGHTKQECRERLADLKKAESAKGRTAAAVPESSEPEGESVAASTLRVAVPVAGVQGSSKRLLVDTGAGGGIAPRGFDPQAQEALGEAINMKTIAGEPLNLENRKTSVLQHGGTQVNFSYRESDVKFPVISVSEATKQGTWLVVGPGTQS